MTKRKTAYIFDMDGTLCDVEPVLHHILKHKNRDTEQFKKDFNRFHEESIDCPPHESVVQMLRDAAADGHSILVVTARKERWRALTSFWLAMNNIHSDALFMRDDHDDRPDYEIKKDILAKVEQLWEVVHAVDDNPKVIKLWEEHGIPTTKIGTWDGEY